MWKQYLNIFVKIAAKRRKFFWDVVFFVHNYKSKNTGVCLMVSNLSSNLRATDNLGFRPYNHWISSFLIALKLHRPALPMLHRVESHFVDANTTRVPQGCQKVKISDKTPKKWTYLDEYIFSKNLIQKYEISPKITCFKITGFWHKKIEFFFCQK